MLTPADFRAGRLVCEPRTAVVAFVADWCGFCARFTREFESAPPDVGAPFLLADVSDDDDPIWDELRIPVVPTVIFFRDGVEVWRRNGKLGLGLPRKWAEEARVAVRAAP